MSVFKISDTVPRHCSRKLHRGFSGRYADPEVGPFICVWSADCVCIVQHPASTRPWLAWLLVSPSKRRQGKGRELIKFLQTILPSIYLGSRPVNKVAHAFYTSLGFQHIGLDEQGYYQFRWRANEH